MKEYEYFVNREGEKEGEKEGEIKRKMGKGYNGKRREFKMEHGERE